MKKLFLLFTFAFLVFGLIACADPVEEVPTPTPTPVEETPTPTPVEETPTPTPVEETPAPIAGFANGTFNYRFAPYELRNTFFSAAEKYLMNNMYGGVPLFANSGFALYSPRLQLPVENSIPVMGFGLAYGTMSADDAATFAGGGVGEYTYRTTLSTNPTTFNQWTYTDAVSADVLGLILGALYVYEFNATKTGYELNPSLALSDPEPVDATLTPTGFTVSKKWTVDIRTDLVWKFHADTDTTGLATTIKAQDFINTYKLALDNGWFRAISGGGDFFATSQAIVGARAYYDAKDTATPLAFSTVGLKALDDHTLEFTFVNDIDEWGVKYWLGSFVMTPVHLELYTRVGTRYGTSPETTAYSGQFHMTSYQPDRRVVVEKNTTHPHTTKIFYTGYRFEIIEDAEIRFQEFIAGNLEAGIVPTARFAQFQNSPLLKRIPGATTFRLMINSLETVAKQRAKFPNSTYVPEPILANQDFKMAMFFAIDRKELAENVLKTSQTQMYLFTDAYLVDPATGVPFRNWDAEQPAADQVGAGLFQESNGFNAAAARVFFDLALDDLVAAGTYTAGTTAAPTIIEIELLIFSGSEAQALFGNFIKTSFENYFNSTKHNIKVQVNVAPKDFPGIYFNYMMTGDFDISIGGISGSALNASSFLDVFSSDNRGGFTLNWGIDTSVPEIDVTYEKPSVVDGVLTFTTVTETWSFDALVEALNGEVVVVNGREVR